jgi:hypothetical protein
MKNIGVMKVTLPSMASLAAAGGARRLVVPPPVPQQQPQHRHVAAVRPDLS